ncbi:MAG: DUF4845 domain-containing protein [Betaproteobacteria bacterium]|nr:DUF4845 domain-containing protein [Betaproteobacteria bacterium]
MKSRQRGISLIGMFFVGFLLVCALLVVFKMVEPYKEYFALQRIVGLLADEGNNGASETELRNSYQRRAMVDGVDAVIKANDLVFLKQGGQMVVEVEYERKAPLVSNVSLLFDFKASSQHSRK